MSADDEVKDCKMAIYGLYMTKSDSSIPAGSVPTAYNSNVSKRITAITTIRSYKPLLNSLNSILFIVTDDEMYKKIKIPATTPIDGNVIRAVKSKLLDHVFTDPIMISYASLYMASADLFLNERISICNPVATLDTVKVFATFVESKLQKMQSDEIQNTPTYKSLTTLLTNIRTVAVDTALSSDLTIISEVNNVVTLVLPTYFSYNRDTVANPSAYPLQLTISCNDIITKLRGNIYKCQQLANLFIDGDITPYKILYILGILYSIMLSEIINIIINASLSPADADFQTIVRTIVLNTVKDSKTKVKQESIVQFAKYNFANASTSTAVTETNARVERDKREKTEAKKVAMQQQKGTASTSTASTSTASTSTASTASSKPAASTASSKPATSTTSQMVAGFTINDSVDIVDMLHTLKVIVPVNYNPSDNETNLSTVATELMDDKIYTAVRGGTRSFNHKRSAIGGYKQLNRSTHSYRGGDPNTCPDNVKENILGLHCTIEGLSMIECSDTIKKVLDTSYGTDYAACNNSTTSVDGDASSTTVPTVIVKDIAINASMAPSEKIRTLGATLAAFKNLNMKNANAESLVNRCHSFIAALINIYIEANVETNIATPWSIAFMYGYKSVIKKT